MNRFQVRSLKDGPQVDILGGLIIQAKIKHYKEGEIFLNQIHYVLIDVKEKFYKLSNDPNDLYGEILDGIDNLDEIKEYILGEYQLSRLDSRITPLKERFVKKEMAVLGLKSRSAFVNVLLSFYQKNHE